MRGRVRIAVGLAALAAIVPSSVAVATQSVHQPRAVSSSVVSSSKGDPAAVLGGGPIRGMIPSAHLQSPKPAGRDLARLKALGVNTVSAYIYTYMSSSRSND